MTVVNFVSVVDVEATRMERARPGFFAFKQELVELPTVLIDTRVPGDGRLGGVVAAVFSTVVRPTENPVLNADTTGFMPITQAEVDAAPSLSTVLVLWDSWLRHTVAGLTAVEPGSVCAMAREDTSHGATPAVLATILRTDTAADDALLIASTEDGWSLVIQKNSSCSEADAAAPWAATTAMYSSVTAECARSESLASMLLATDGPWDIAAYLCHEIHRKKLTALWRPFMARWWNTRTAYATSVVRSSEGERHRVPVQLSRMGLHFVGREHNGLDDSLNIASLARALLGHGVVPVANDGVSPSISKADPGAMRMIPWFQRDVLQSFARLA